jgi:hypothetical protein
MPQPACYCIRVAGGHVLSLFNFGRDGVARISRFLRVSYHHTGASTQTGRGDAVTGNVGSPRRKESHTWSGQLR